MWSIRSWYRESRATADAQRKYIRHRYGMWLRTVVNGQPEVAPDQTIAELKAFNRQRLEAVPSGTQYPELRGMRDLVEASWRGVRDGAQLDDDTWAAYCGGSEFYHRVVCNRTHARHKANCSYVYFPKSEAGPLLANNLDSCPEEMFTEPKWPAMSEHLLFGSVSSGVYFDEESPETFPAPVHRLVARYCRTTEEAVDLLTRYKYFWGPCNSLLVDRHHKVAMIEKTACRIGVRYSPDGYGFITAMTQEHPEIRDFVHAKRAESVQRRGLPTPCADTVYWDLQDKRGTLMNELLDEARQNPTTEKMRQIMQFRDPVRGNVCGNGETYFAEGPPSEHTLRTAVWQLRESKALWWARDSQTGKPSFQGDTKETNFDHVWTWDS